jgi:hypothetical protein
MTSAIADEKALDDRPDSRQPIRVLLRRCGCQGNRGEWGSTGHSPLPALIFEADGPTIPPCPTGMKSSCYASRPRCLTILRHVHEGNLSTVLVNSRGKLAHPVDSLRRAKLFLTQEYAA